MLDCNGRPQRGHGSALVRAGHANGADRPPRGRGSAATTGREIPTAAPSSARARERLRIRPAPPAFRSVLRAGEGASFGPVVVGFVKARPPRGRGSAVWNSPPFRSNIPSTVRVRVLRVGAESKHDPSPSTALVRARRVGVPRAPRAWQPGVTFPPTASSLITGRGAGRGGQGAGSQTASARFIVLPPPRSKRLTSTDRFGGSRGRLGTTRRGDSTARRRFGTNRRGFRPGAGWRTMEAPSRRSASPLSVGARRTE